MSIKKKGSSAKTGKKVPVKKAVKPPAKKSATKKTAAKPAKKATKPLAKSKPVVKASKPAPKAAAKKPLKSKPVAKAAPKKPASSSASKKPAAPKKSIPVAKKAAPPKKAAAPVSKNSKPSAKEKEKPVKPAPPAPKATPPREVAKPAQAESKKSQDTTVAKKPVNDKKPEVMAITNTIPVKRINEISASKIASISHSITNPIKKTDSYAVKVEKEPNGKFELEFVVHASSEMLYEFLSTPSGLSEWFCDDLNIRNGIYTFIWEDQLQQARLLKTVDLQVVRFQWVDKTDGSYFEFRIQRDDLTNDISLIITDFADSVGDRESSKLLWNSQVEKLMHVIGSIF